MWIRSTCWRSISYYAAGWFFLTSVCLGKGGWLQGWRAGREGGNRAKPCQQPIPEPKVFRTSAHLIRSHFALEETSDSGKLICPKRQQREETGSPVTQGPLHHPPGDRYSSCCPRLKYCHVIIIQWKKWCCQDPLLKRNPTFSRSVTLFISH